MQRQFVSLVNGELFWNRSRIEEYFQSSFIFLKYLLILIHMTGGQPARGTELETISITNTHVMQGSTYWWNSRVMIMLQYHKARRITEKKPIDSSLSEFDHLKITF